MLDNNDQWWVYGLPNGMRYAEMQCDGPHEALACVLAAGYRQPGVTVPWQVVYLQGRNHQPRVTVSEPNAGFGMRPFSTWGSALPYHSLTHFARDEAGGFAAGAAGVVWKPMFDHWANACLACGLDPLQEEMLDEARFTEAWAHYRNFGDLPFVPPFLAPAKGPAGEMIMQPAWIGPPPR